MNITQNLFPDSTPHLQPSPTYTDLYHAATCLKANVILITNDKDFDKIAKVGIIKVWSITKAFTSMLFNIPFKQAL